MLTNSNMGGGSLELNCNKKKGFTLIELLAVIVILAIIANITITANSSIKVNPFFLLQFNLKLTPPILLYVNINLPTFLS